MKYRNTKTGAVIDSPCVISGGDWVTEVTAKVTEPKEPEKREPRKKAVK